MHLCDRRPLALLLFALVCFLVFPNRSTAAEVAGIKVEDTLAIYNNTLVLNGAAGVYSGKNLMYIVRVYARQPFGSVEELYAMPGPKRLIVTAIKEVDTAPIVKFFNRGLEATANKNEMAKLVPGMMRVGTVFGNRKVLRPGESLSMDWVPITGMVFYVGNQMQGEPLKEPEFFRAAVSVWMGDSAIDPLAKGALLGKNKPIT